MDEFEVGKRRKRVITYSAVAAGCFVLMLVVVFASGYDNLGYGSANNMVVTWLMIISLVLTLMALISGCRVRTPKGGITHWKRVGLFALIVWGAVIALFTAAALSQFAPPLAPILGVIGGGVLGFHPVAGLVPHLDGCQRHSWCPASGTPCPTAFWGRNCDDQRANPR